MEVVPPQLLAYTDEIQGPPGQQCAEGSSVAAQGDDTICDDAGLEDNEELPSELPQLPVSEEKDHGTSLFVEGGDGHPTLLPEIVQASLSSLNHNGNGLLVLTTVNLSSLNLDSIECLTMFTELQKVVLDNNALTSLTPLSKAKSLVVVSAANNNLTTSVFHELKYSSETLQELNVSNNVQIDNLVGVESLPFLRVLQADACSISALKKEQFSSLQSLSVLSLAANRIDTIDADAFVECPVRDLTLRENLLSELTPLQPLARTLSSLDVAENNIMHFIIVANFKRLRKFDFSGNNAYDIAEVYSLARLPLLRTASLIGNPLCSLHAEADGVESDTASDIVQPDEPVPDASGAQDVTPQPFDRPTAQKKCHRDAAQTSAMLFASEEDTLAVLTPHEEDRIEFLSKTREEQYRLRVLWRAPGITVLDGVQVLPEELAEAHNLEGGNDRGKRTEAKKKFFKEQKEITISAGPAGAALRAGRGQL